MIRSGIAALFLLSAVSLTGCRQGIGDRCQLTSDCQSDLICVLPVGGTAQSGGTCQSNTALLDMGAATDFTAAPADMTNLEDFSTVDANESTDAAPADLATID